MTNEKVARYKDIPQCKSVISRGESSTPITKFNQVSAKISKTDQAAYDRPLDPSLLTLLSTNLLRSGAAEAIGRHRRESEIEGKNG